MKAKLILFAWDIAIIGAMLACLLFASGCFTRTVYVPAGQPVRLRQNVPSVKVWCLDSNNKPYPSVKDLKEGGYYSYELLPEK